MKRTSLIASALFGAVVGFASLASASVVELFPLQSLADYSSFVVRGKVLSTEAVRDPVMGIVTITQVQVASSLKGKAPTTVTVVEPGGEPKDGVDVGLKISGMPAFKANEEVLVFLEGGKGKYDGFLRTVGMAQGKFQIQKNNLGKEIAVRDLTGIALMQIGKSGTLEPVKTADVPNSIALDSISSVLKTSITK